MVSVTFELHLDLGVLSEVGMHCLIVGSEWLVLSSGDVGL